MPTGQVGEVCIRGPNVTAGYKDNPKANEEAFAGTRSTCTGTGAGHLASPRGGAGGAPLLQTRSPSPLLQLRPAASSNCSLRCSPAGGWFHTGDQGKLDEEGYLTLTGRIKELINRGGEKISPIEVGASWRALGQAFVAHARAAGRPRVL